LPLYLINRHETRGEDEVIAHAYLTCTPNGSEWSPSRSTRFIPGEGTPDTITCLAGWHQRRSGHGD